MKQQQVKYQMENSDCQKDILLIKELKTNQKRNQLDNTSQFLIDQFNFEEVESQNKQLKNKLYLAQKQLKQKQIIVNNLISLLDKKNKQIKSLQQFSNKKQTIIISPKKWDKSNNQNQSSDTKNQNYSNTNTKNQNSSLVQKIIQLTNLKRALSDLKIQLANLEKQNTFLKKCNTQIQNHNRILMADNLKNIQCSVEDTEKYLLNQDVGDYFSIQIIKNQNQSLKVQKKRLQEQNIKLKIELGGKEKPKQNQIIKPNILPRSGSSKNLKVGLQNVSARSNRVTANNSFMNPTKASLQKQKNIINTPKGRSKSKSFQNRQI